MHALVKKGLIHVVYEAEADMLPDRQVALMKDLDKELAGGLAVLVFNVKKAAGVDKAVPAFWLDVTKRLAPKLCAMAIASPSMVVRTAASGFSVANKLRQVRMAVQAFDDDAKALKWAAEQLGAQPR
jgi:hypothetical protein